MSTTVLISGSGIAGPALAHWLRRHGFTPTVVERSATPRAGGYKIDLRGAAVEVAERMGILDTLRENEAGMRTMSFVDASGRRVAELPSDLFMGRGTDDVEIMRGKLAQILVEATEGGVEYIHGDAITGLVETADGIVVTFEHAAPRTFDLVIGADGLHSRVRALVFGAEEQFVHDLGHGVAIYRVPNHLGLEREELLYSTVGRTVSAYSEAGSTDAAAMFLFPTPQGMPADRRVPRREVRGRRLGDRPAARRRRRRPRLLRRRRLPDPHGRLVAWAGGAGRRRRLLPEPRLRAGLEPRARRRVRAGR
jgi:2-polyprenyl-6-methoxyphenol hydroxylase-like FAD-dependent oxidoreductase